MQLSTHPGPRLVAVDQHAHGSPRVVQSIDSCSVPNGQGGQVHVRQLSPPGGSGDRDRICRALVAMSEFPHGNIWTGCPTARQLTVLRKFPNSSLAGKALVDGPHFHHPGPRETARARRSPGRLGAGGPPRAEVRRNERITPSRASVPPAGRPREPSGRVRLGLFMPSSAKVAPSNVAESIADLVPRPASSARCARFRAPTWPWLWHAAPQPTSFAGQFCRNALLHSRH
jgi:hypothetical protein